jgi:hypothetical protein
MVVGNPSEQVFSHGSLATERGSRAALLHRADQPRLNL